MNNFAADSEYLYLFLAAWNLDQEFGSSMLVLHCFSAFLLCLLRMVKLELKQGTLGWTDRVFDVTGACLSKRLSNLQLYWTASHLGHQFVVDLDIWIPSWQRRVYHLSLR